MTKFGSPRQKHVKALISCNTGENFDSMAELQKRDLLDPGINVDEKKTLTHFNWSRSTIELGSDLKISKIYSKIVS